MNRFRHLLGRPAGLLRRLSATARLLLVAGVVALFAGGAAVAYWTTTGAGSANASAGTLTNVTIDDVVISGTLYPLSDDLDVDIPVTNPNSYAVEIYSISVGEITSDEPDCSGATTGVELDLSLVTGTIPANETLHYPAKASMSEDSVSECQGETFSATLTLVVRK